MLVVCTPFFITLIPTSAARSIQAVAFARRTVGAGVWRANYMTISAWASRTYGAVAAV